MAHRSIIAFFASVLVFSADLSAQIAVNATYPPHAPIVAKCQVEVPSGWEIRVRWTIRSPQGSTAERILVGTSAHIWASPGRHAIEMRALLLEWRTIVDQAGVEHRVIADISEIDDEKSFTVTGSSPPPPDPDDPEIPEPPDTPDSPYGLTRSSFEWALSVPEPHRSAAIHQIALNFGIASVSTTVPSVTLEALKVANLRVLPNPSAARTAWLPFFEKWSQRMDELLATGKLANITSSYQKAFAETQAGLEAAAKEVR